MGSGLSSLCLAHLLIRRGVPGRKIVIIEILKQPGGLFGSLKHDETTKFDIGMHTIQMTGEKEIDDILLEVVEEKEWCKFSPPKHDLAGVILGNQVFENGPYFNLEFFHENEYRRLSRSLRSHLGDSMYDEDFENKRNNTEEATNARVYLHKQFGPEVAQDTYVRALQMRYGFKADQLDVIATQLTPMNRILADKEFKNEELLVNGDLRHAVAWSDQRTLPLKLSSRKPVYYPKKDVIHLIIDRLIELLKLQNVNFEFDTRIEQLEIEKNIAKQLKVSTSGKSKHINITRLFWTGNTANLLKLLRQEDKPMKFENPLKTTIATIKINRKFIKQSDCMYFFNYLNKTGLYRLNNYDAYMGIDHDEKQAKISLEYIIAKDANLLPEESIQHLIQFNFLDSKTKEVSIKIHDLPHGHPLPVLSNIEIEAFHLHALNELNIRNLTYFGSSLVKRRFFQKDVLVHLLEAIDHD